MAYIQNHHGSRAVFQIMKKLTEERYKNRVDDEENKHKLAIFLSILEPVIVNDENAMKAVESDILPLLTEFITFTAEDLSQL